MMRAADKGDLYVHQDANFNVIGVTDLGGNFIERYVLEPYGELTVHQLSSYGDRDGDGEVDSVDKGTPGVTCTGTVTGACRILDLDFDDDYDSSDATLFDNLDAGNAVHPGRRYSALGQHFGHQGLWFDAELGQYYNRARQYSPQSRRFGQPDPESYRDSLSLHQSRSSNPVTFVDPTGRAIAPPPTISPWFREYTVTVWLFDVTSGLDAWPDIISPDGDVAEDIWRRCGIKFSWQSVTDLDFKDFIEEQDPGQEKLNITRMFPLEINLLSIEERNVNINAFYVREIDVRDFGEMEAWGAWFNAHPQYAGNHRRAAVGIAAHIRLGGELGKTTLAHEFGHAFGLTHCNEQGWCGRTNLMRTGREVPGNVLTASGRRDENQCRAARRFIIMNWGG
jgi:RHS repeat-associated protein